MPTWYLTVMVFKLSQFGVQVFKMTFPKSSNFLPKHFWSAFLEFGNCHVSSYVSKHIATRQIQMRSFKNIVLNFFTNIGSIVLIEANVLRRKTLDRLDLTRSLREKVWQLLHIGKTVSRSSFLFVLP